MHYSRHAALLMTFLAVPLTSAFSQGPGQDVGRLPSQTLRHGEITLAEARAILKANPAAIPGYPARFFRLLGQAVLLEQLLDSATGAVIRFREDRDEPPRWSNFHRVAETTGDAMGFAQLNPRLWQYQDAREGYRQVGEVSVRWMGPIGGPVPKDLLDKLAAIPD